MARKFLYVIAAIIIVILAAGVVYQLFPGWIARTAFVPSTEFKPQAAVAITFSDDPMMGMTCDRFTGSATAKLATQSFVLRTAALR